MLTPARRHFESVMAQNRGTAVNTLADQTAYEQMLHRLRVDKNRLQGIQANKGKAEAKRELLPNYQGWIDGVLASDSGQTDAVLTTVMLWNIDAGNVAEALRIGEYVIRHKLAMHDNFNRTPAVVLVDEISDPVLAKFKASQAEVPLSVDLLKALDGLTANEDMPEPVRAKLWKAIGYTLRISADTQPEALEYLRKAIAEYSDIGVKRDIEILERLIKAASGASGEGDIPRSSVTAMTVTGADASGPEAALITAESDSEKPLSEGGASEAPAPAAEVSETAPTAPAKRGRPAGTKTAAGKTKTSAAAAKKTSGASKARTGAAKAGKPQ
ncbi:phage terminase small subunit [Pantoea sp. y20]